MQLLVLPGINIQAPWAQLLLEGKKKIETRTYRLPDKFRGSDLWLIETPGRSGSFRARVIGVIRFSDCKRYQSSEEFYQDSALHLIDRTTGTYGWRDETPKFGWLVEHVEAKNEFAPPSPRGIVYSLPFAEVIDP